MNINTSHHQWSLSEITGNPNPLAKSKGARPLMRVVRLADGEEIMIEPTRFHEALHKQASPPEAAHHLSVTTPLGTSVVEITHEYLEQLPFEAIKALPVARYVPGYNVMTKRALISGVLTVLGKLGEVKVAETLEQREERLMSSWQAKQDAPAPKAEAVSAPVKESKAKPVPKASKGEAPSKGEG